jgi:hypothetical protein
MIDNGRFYQWLPEARVAVESLFREIFLCVYGVPASDLAAGVFATQWSLQAERMFWATKEKP